MEKKIKTDQSFNILKSEKKINYKAKKVFKQTFTTAYYRFKIIFQSYRTKNLRMISAIRYLFSSESSIKSRIDSNYNINIQNNFLPLLKVIIWFFLSLFISVSIGNL